MWKIILIILGLLYVISPLDILPDFIPGWGWLDDIVVIGLLWRYLAIQKKKKEAFARYQQQQSSGGTDNPGAGASEDGPVSQSREAQDPYTILGLKHDASEQEIKQAYRRLAAKYHPDKVEHLGAEFKALAEDRFKQIQQAYEQLKPR
jgi:DnaJ like chaperone protein